MSSQRVFRSSFCVFLLTATACSSSSGSSPAAEGDAGAAPATGSDGVVYTVLVQGPLKADVASSQSLHDQTAGSAKGQAQAAGDVAHDTLVDKDAPASATTPPAFLSIDQWTNLDAQHAFFTSQPIQQFFSAFYASTPALSTWTPRDGWTAWGSIKAVQGGVGGAYAITLRGRYQGAEADAKATHNGLVANVPAPGPVALGNVSHFPFASTDDPSELLIVEIWNNQASQEHLYSDPGFQQALSKFWSAPPEIHRWNGTGWVQW
jgi:quinol monooxygenase YgiN